MVQVKPSSGGMESTRFVGMILAGLSVLGVSILATIVIPRMRVAARNKGAITVGAVHVVFNQAPSWLGESDLRTLSGVVASQAGPDPGDRSGLGRAKSALEKCGWFTDVSQVRRSSVGELEVDGHFATPFALVCDSDGEHLVDSEGRLLPRTYPTGEGPLFPRLMGCRERRPTQAGTRWIGADLAAGLRLAQLIDSQRWRSQITSIEVGDYAMDGQLRMKTRGGCLIEWGHAPGEETPAEVSAAQKLRYLQYFDAALGRVDGECTGNLDVRTDCVGVR